MQRKTITVGAAIIAATVAGSTLVTSPAYALAGKFSVNLNGRVTSVTSSGIDLLQDSNFDSVDDSFGFNNRTGDFSTYTAAFVKDLSFTTPLVNGLNPNININSPGFITLEGGLLGTITFDLKNLTNVVFSDIDAGGTQGNFSAGVKGLFQPSGSSNLSTLDAIVTFRTNQGGNGGSIDLTAVPIPTPALLPGLVAMGIGVMRKRKAEAVKSES